MSGSQAFRTTPTYSAGTVAAKIIQCRVTNVNLVNCTVDAVSKFDRYEYADIPVSSPYIHHSAGEGLSITPEIGATALVCIPSDTTTPFVMAFLMVPETIDTGTEEDPMGTNPRDNVEDTPTTISFAGGRPKAKPGDIILCTRDNNFVILHRGGILQLGADELTQRMYIPMNHFMMDISQNYAHHNSGGSIVWGLQEGAGETSYPSEYTQTFRVLANDQFADVRIKIGKVKNVVLEAGEDFNFKADLDQLGLRSDLVIYEVDICPGGFNAETGYISNENVAKNVKLKFFIDSDGGVFAKAAGSMFIGSKKKIRIKALEGVEIQSGQTINMAASQEIALKGSCVRVQGDVVRLGAGQNAVATVGSTVVIKIPPIPPGGVPLTQDIIGTITSGNQGVLA